MVLAHRMRMSIQRMVSESATVKAGACIECAHTCV